MADLKDWELVESFRNGNAGAFNVLVWRWQKPILNFLARYVGSLSEAEDLTQQTFLRAFKKMKGLRESRKFSPWLYQIAVNLARDHLRRQKRHSEVSLDRPVDKSSEAGQGFGQVFANSPDPGPEQQMEKDQLQNILNQSLQAISADQREVIIMRFYQDLKFQEIAQVLDIPEGTAKTRFYYGLKALRNVLNHWGLTREVWPT